jgi:two-component system, LytTR family, sensor kinase
MRKLNNRFIYMALLGVAISFLLHFMVGAKPEGHNLFFDIFTSIFITFLVWEGNLRIDHLMNKKFPWLKRPIKRILVQLPVIVIYSALVIYFAMLGFDTYVCELPGQAKSAFMIFSVIIGVMVSLIILPIEVSKQFFKHWKNSLIEVEKYKTESLQAQLQNLKNQINPHFLFNNMSVLSSLVYKDPDKAVDFINQLSKVYRYLLDNKDKELVTLEDELTFIRSYTYLLQIRFDTNIKFDFSVENNALQKLVPPMAIQILVENAIKHNEISEEQPLTVSVKTKGDVLEVNNNLQLRINSEPGSKTGLKNIKDRLKYFTDLPVEIIEDASYFNVKLPLLFAK